MEMPGGTSGSEREVAQSLDLEAAARYYCITVRDPEADRYQPETKKKNARYPLENETCSGKYILITGVADALTTTAGSCGIQTWERGVNPSLGRLIGKARKKEPDGKRG